MNKNKVKNIVPSSHSLYNKLNGMINRCHKAKEGTKAYKNYMSRGITVCYEWRHDINKNGFNNFYMWAINNGWKQGLSIDRIDVNGNYEPSNCQWITMFKQQANKTTTLRITHNGETKHASEWARIIGISPSTINERISRGWDIKDVLLSPTDTEARLQSDIKGVTWNVSRNRWKVMDSLNGKDKPIFIGWYHTKEKAEFAKIKFYYENIRIHNKEICNDMLIGLEKLREKYIKEVTKYH